MDLLHFLLFEIRLSVCLQLQRLAYTNKTGIKMQETGLWVKSKSHAYISASSDGLVTDANGHAGN